MSVSPNALAFTADDVGSVYCPECWMHVGKLRILWWHNLPKAEQQALCPHCSPPKMELEATLNWARWGF